MPKYLSTFSKKIKEIEQQIGEFQLLEVWTYSTACSTLTERDRAKIWTFLLKSLSFSSLICKKNGQNRTRDGRDTAVFRRHPTANFRKCSIPLDNNGKFSLPWQRAMRQRIHAILHVAHGPGIIYIICEFEADRIKSDEMASVWNFSLRPLSPLIPIYIMKQASKHGRKKKIWNASRICVSSLRRGHANLLCIVPILVYVLRRVH